MLSGCVSTLVATAGRSCPMAAGMLDATRGRKPYCFLLACNLLAILIDLSGHVPIDWIVQPLLRRSFFVQFSAGICFIPSGATKSLIGRK